jgi:AraC-like DNA-binding protein
MTEVLGGAQRFSTDMFAPRERIAAWREFIGRALFRLEIEPLVDDGFEAETISRALPGLGFVYGSTAAVRNGRRPHMVDTDDLLISVAQSGTACFATCGREAFLAPGDAVVVGGGEAGFQESLAPYRFVGLRLPRSALLGAVPGLEDRLGRKIPAQTPALRLLRPYTDALLPGTDVTPRELPVMAAHMRDLVALALGATGEAAAAAAARGGRAARLRVIKADMEARLHEPGLSTATVAARHRLTERALQRLFETEGTSCMAFILERRLVRVHRVLTDPRFAEHRIKTVVFDAGFGHLSHFWGAFRARFGASPAEVRARALQAPEAGAHASEAP